MVVAAALVQGCNHALVLGRTGDNLGTADPYALCKARRSIWASQAVADAIRLRQIDCRQWDNQIAAEDAARKAAMFNAGAIMMTTPIVPRPAVAPAAGPQPSITRCTPLGPSVQCTTY